MRARTAGITARRLARYAALAPAIAREPDATHEIRSIVCPVLVIVGALDAVFLDASMAIAGAAPA
ncbi:MAG: hypothetical protein ACO3ZY_14325, partial [Phycisphaerales bacterium]